MRSRSRRRFLIQGGAALAGALVPRLALTTPRSSRSLALVSVHTGEELEVTYWVGGSYVARALADINHILRDHRTGEEKVMDPGLVDLLHAVRSEISTTEAFEIISGYRSPKTNAQLRQIGRSVAQGSLHMAGKAADIRLAGVSLEDLRDVGKALGRGGVGYYEGEFVHVDVGRVRFW